MRWIRSAARWIAGEITAAALIPYKSVIVAAMVGASSLLWGASVQHRQSMVIILSVLAATDLLLVAFTRPADPTREDAQQ